MIRVSLNEVYSESLKAFRSIGVDWGIAKDAANLSKWIANHNLGFMCSIFKTADLYRNRKFSHTFRDNTYQKPLNAIFMGMLLVEYVSTENIKWEGYVYIFLLAAMAIISDEQEVDLILTNKNGEVIGFAKEKKIFVKIGYNKKINYFVLNRLSSKKVLNKANLKILEKSNVVNINNKCWEKLKLMAFNTYVSENDTSKRNAGY